MSVIIDARAYDLNIKFSVDTFWSGPAATTENITFAAANAVIFAPFTVTRGFTAQRMAVTNGGVVNGNTRMGIYDRDGVLLASTAATAQASAQDTQIIALSTATTLGPGLYFMALSNSGTTGQYGGMTTQAPRTTLNAYGWRGATSGGIVTTPSIADVSTSVLSSTIIAIFFQVLGFTSSQLVTP